MPLREKALATIKRFRMFRKGEAVLVGVSGGPDSVALLCLLNSLKKELNLKLRVAHLDHKLRRDSACDAQFVKALARKLNLPFSVSRVDIKKIAQKGSIEEISRKQRIIFFKGLVKRYSLQKVALGHNLDDQAETVLMRILRGSGLYGLQAIMPVRTIDGLIFVRPLIEVSRREINSFLAQDSIKARLDSSNLESVFFRNKIRNKLIPFLESGFNKNIKNNLSSLAEVISLDYEYLALNAQKQWKKVLVSSSAKSIRLNLTRFLKLPLALERMLLRLAISRLLGSTRKFDYRHWREVEDLIRYRPDGAIVDLPKGLCASKDEKVLRIYRIKH